MSMFALTSEAVTDGKVMGTSHSGGNFLTDLIHFLGPPDWVPPPPQVLLLQLLCSLGRGVAKGGGRVAKGIYYIL